MATLVMVPVMEVAVLMLSAAPPAGGPGEPLAPGEPDGPAGPVVPLQAVSSTIRTLPMTYAHKWPRCNLPVPFTKAIDTLPKRSRRSGAGRPTPYTPRNQQIFFILSSRLRSLCTVTHREARETASSFFLHGAEVSQLSYAPGQRPGAALMSEEIAGLC